MKIKNESPSIGIVSTIKAPEYQVREFVEYYLKNGINKLFLFFDDPNDPSLKLYKDDKRVISISCSNEYWAFQKNGQFEKLDTSIIIYRQRINASYALELARESGISWLCHIDIDEIIYPVKRLKQFLGRTHFKSIRFTVMEAVPETLKSPAYISDIRLFKKPASLYFPTMLRYPFNSLKLIIARSIGLRLFFEINNDYFRGHMKSKMCFRTDLPIKEVRIHKPVYRRKVITYRTLRILLLHYEGIDHVKWVEKWRDRIRSSNLRNAYRPSTFRLLQKITELSLSNPSEEDFINLYMKLYLFQKKDKRLLVIFGLIKRVNPFTV